MGETAVQKYDPNSDVAVQEERSVVQVAEHRMKIQELMKVLLVEGEHYGKIFQGQQKPSLLKAGAEYIGFMMKLQPFYEVQRFDLPDGHMRYIVTCRLRHTPSGIDVGEGVGSCTSMESKYRYRTQSVASALEVPRAFWTAKKQKKFDEAKAILATAMGDDTGEGDYWVTKTDEGWFISERLTVEHDNPADLDNTILKMGKKRAYVDAIISNTAASDFFTQDLEDIRDNLESLKRAKAKEHEEAEKKLGDDEAKLPPFWFKYLESMGEIKGSIVDVTGSDKVYYKVLKRYGMEKANDIDFKEFTPAELRAKCQDVYVAMQAALQKEQDVPEALRKDSK